ncbi:MAG: hypothetical protein ABSA16_11990 [Thermoguttaceae bacterium]
MKLYDLEKYLFDVVRSNFERDRKLNAFDFFCIIIWKANRAKSIIAKKLLERDGNRRKDLDAIVGDMTKSLADADTEKEKMRILIEKWEFRLPMASAILSVLWPDKFTVFDVRACEQLGGDYKSIPDKAHFEDLWNGYNRYIEAVKNTVPEVAILRDKDRVLWAKSFEKQLNKDIAMLFQKEELAHKDEG